MDWLSNQIQSQLSQYQTYAAAINNQLQTLEKIKAQIWDMTMIENQEGRFLIFPIGTQIDPGWTVGSGRKPAIKIGSH